jgi:gluconolactonase
MADGFQRPTGIAFSPDGSVLYVADSRANTIRTFRVGHDNSLEGGDVLVIGTAPSLDSMRTDVEGRIWIACSDGVRCYDPDGSHLGTIRTPSPAANVEFGGLRRNVLYICATTSLHSIMLATNGATRTADARPGQPQAGTHAPAQLTQRLDQVVTWSKARAAVRETSIAS